MYLVSSTFILSFLCVSPFFFNGFFYLIFILWRGCGRVVKAYDCKSYGQLSLVRIQPTPNSCVIVSNFIYCIFAAIIHFLFMRFVRVVEKGKPRDFCTNVRYCVWLCVVYIWVIFTYFVSVEGFYYSFVYPLFAAYLCVG